MQIPLQEKEWHIQVILILQIINRWDKEEHILPLVMFSLCKIIADLWDNQKAGVIAIKEVKMAMSKLLANLMGDTLIVAKKIWPKNS